MDKMMAGLIAVVLGTTMSATWAAEDSVQVLAACYRQAQNSPDKLSNCLTREFDMLKKEYKDVTDRIFVLAKSKDKNKGKRGLTASQQKTNNAFESYVESECNFMSDMNTADKLSQRNEELSCRVNLYRMRIDLLENHFLSASK